MAGRDAPAWPPEDEVALALPFTGPWRVRNSPARRVPSHGTDLFGTRYAVDFVGVDARGRDAAHRDWRTALATEPPQRFAAFGRPVLAPAAGVVVAVHDGEEDHGARRSPPALLAYAATQAGRVRAGTAAVAGNHVVLRLPDGRAHVVLVHLRRGSVRVVPGQEVRAGQRLGECGNSGNSTQPHVHLQVADGPDPWTARALPVVFTGYRERRRGTTRVRERGVPAEGSVVEPLAAGG
ncbi:M23 family metallopeptidase [Kineococcus sp. SYSU DK004]|uniref:M23 family metallopeptidase n=1 Tax=Kineococcus sp. SYSU DK004 TaxID=3383125 RepID=UPI003D7C65AF